MIDFKGSQFEKDIILWGVRWYVAYPISYRQLEEMMGERGVAVDRSTLNRWVIKYAPEFEKVLRRHQCLVGRSWRLDETYVRIKGKWTFLYRAVNKDGPAGAFQQLSKDFDNCSDITSGQGWTACWSRGRSTLAYPVVVSIEVCRSTAAMAGKGTSWRCIWVAAEWRRTCDPWTGVSMPVRCIVRVAILLIVWRVSNTKGAQAVRKTESVVREERRVR